MWLGSSVSAKTGDCSTPIQNLSWEARYEVGIIKNCNSDVKFEKIQTQPLLMDNVLYDHPYRLAPQSIHMKSFHHISEYIDRTCWRDEIIQPVCRIIEDANKKRIHLAELLLMNPFLPWHQSQWFHFQHSECVRIYTDIASQASKLPGVGFFAHILLSIFFGFPLFLFALVQYSTFFMLDFLFCRCNVFRGGEKEREFILSMCKAHPNLDTDQIDKSIISDLRALAGQLAGRYQRFQVHFERKVEKVVNEELKDFYEQDYFYISFQIKTECSDVRRSLFYSGIDVENQADHIEINRETSSRKSSKAANIINSQIIVGTKTQRESDKVDQVRESNLPSPRTSSYYIPPSIRPPSINLSDDTKSTDSILLSP